MGNCVLVKDPKIKVIADLPKVLDVVNERQAKPVRSRTLFSVTVPEARFRRAISFAEASFRCSRKRTCRELHFTVCGT